MPNTNIGTTLRPKYRIEALKLESGFGAHYTIFIIRNRHNNIGNYLSPYNVERGLIRLC